MADTPQAAEGVNFLELTDEEQAVLKECRINSIYFRGLPAGVFSVLFLRQAVNAGLFPHIKRFAALYYTGLFGFGFLAGVSSYKGTCIAKIMKLENSSLADQVRAKHMTGNRGSHWQTGNTPHEPQDVDSQGKGWASNRFNVPNESPPTEDHIPRIDTSAAPVQSTEDAPAAPSLYFDVDKAKENKDTSYAELRKKHRERWTPPNVSSSGSSREQPRHRHEGDLDSKTGSSDASSSWFDTDNSSDERSNQESNRETGQRSYNQRDRPSYRQGPPPKKNKYGDVVDG